MRGNLLSFLFVDLPVGEPVAQARLQKIAAATRRRKSSGAVQATSTMIRLAALAPPAVANATLARTVFDPGSFCVRAGTEVVRVREVGRGGRQLPSSTCGRCSVGHLAIAHEDGTEVDLRAGNAYMIEPRHDASVTGDEPVVAFEFEARAAKECAHG
jgi:WS/DGAT C-terminal domain